MLIYEESVSFVKSNPKFGAQSETILENDIYICDFGVLVAPLSLTLKVEP